MTKLFCCAKWEDRLIVMYGAQCLQYGTINIYIFNVLHKSDSVAMSIFINLYSLIRKQVKYASVYKKQTKSLAVIPLQ